MTTFLHKQKKVDLQELAKAAEVKGYDDLLKDDLVSALDEKLKANPSAYTANPIFSEYYKRGGSPVKRERVVSSSIPTADGEAKTARRRRQTIKAKEETDGGAEETSPEASTALTTRTPRAIQRVASQVPLPPTPQAVSQYIARQQANITTKATSLYKKSGITESVEDFRDSTSTVVGVQILTLLVEAVGLQRETFPWRYAFDVPAFPAFRTHAYAVKLPDFFVLVTSAFWAPSTLWLATSLFVPLLFAYFFNFSHSIRGAGVKTRASPVAYTFDPLSYNVSKALITWLVYSQGFTFGNVFNRNTVALVDSAFYGGYQGVLIGTAIGAIASVYEAILTKH